MYLEPFRKLFDILQFSVRESIKCPFPGSDTSNEQVETFCYIFIPSILCNLTRPNHKSKVFVSGVNGQNEISVLVSASRYLSQRKSDFLLYLQHNGSIQVICYPYLARHCDSRYDSRKR